MVGSSSSTALTDGWKAVARAANAVDGIRWNIQDQIYVPKHVDEVSFTWHATFRRCCAAGSR